MFLALEHGHVGKKYLATDGNVYSMDDLGNAVRNALGKKTLKLKIPLPIISVIANISETIGNIRGKATILNKEKMNELGAESWVCDMSESFNDLGFTPQYNLDSGMKEAVKWYKEKGWI
jgi:nucleoside-diphosphate-sugar epimerase